MAKDASKVTYADRAIRLGGFTLAHAAWSVRELPEKLIPLGVLEKPGLFGPKRELCRYTAPTYEQAIEGGRAAIAEKKSMFQSWALAYERHTSQADEGDTFVIEVDDATMRGPLHVLQSYRPFSSGAFKLIGAPAFILNDRPAEPELAARLNKGILEGVASHHRAKKLWQAWAG